VFVELRTIVQFDTDFSHTTRLTEIAGQPNWGGAGFDLFQLSGTETDKAARPGCTTSGTAK